ncbi:MAG: sugar phosphate isomerase/epimerase family protein [Bacillota bacterium]|nr:sugar phosphate isomerase/epimerase family protein [Bacillota bacterium]
MTVPRLDVGIVTRSFPGLDNAATARFMADNGFASTELCLVQSDSNRWHYNGQVDLEGMDGTRLRRIADIYRAAGVAVPAFGIFTNLIEKDDGKRRANLENFVLCMEYAAEAGISIVATECGFDPESRGVIASEYETRFSRLIESLGYLTTAAGRIGVRIALEPCVLDVVPSAKRMADTIRQVGSEHLGVLLDPANLIANSSERDMFCYLTDHILYFHGKDRRLNDTYGRVVGDGDIDWPLFLSLYHAHTPGRPFILEYANIDNCLAIRDRVLAYNASLAGSA